MVALAHLPIIRDPNSSAVTHDEIRDSNPSGSASRSRPPLRWRVVATMQMPRLASPGSAGYQRYNALQYDPYPLDDIAPPVAGTRPQEYSRPIPEVTRGQAFNAQPRTPQPVLPPSFAAPCHR